MLFVNMCRMDYDLVANSFRKQVLWLVNYFNQTFCSMINMENVVGTLQLHAGQVVGRVAPECACLFRRCADVFEYDRNEKE